MDSRQKEIALALIQMAWADRHWAAEEESLVRNMLRRMGCESELENLKFHKQLDLAHLERVLPDHESRLTAMRMLLAVAFADNALASEELDHLLRMAERLAITPPELEQLRQDVLRLRSQP